MKALILGLLVVGFAGSALAIERPDLDLRVWRLTSKFQALQAHPETAIPAGVLQNAKGIILLDRTKAGFIVAYQGGNGVAMVRQADGLGWSPVAFVGASDVSLGLQVGREEEFYAILLMDENASRLLTETNYEYGGELRGTAGDSSSGKRGAISPYKTHVLIYSDRKGLFGGVDLSAGSIVPDDKANYIYYGRAYTMSDILFGEKVRSTDAAKGLAGELNAAAHVDQFSELQSSP